jgi:hypothetical protein
VHRLGAPGRRDRPRAAARQIRGPAKRTARFPCLPGRSTGIDRYAKAGQIPSGKRNSWHIPFASGTESQFGKQVGPSAIVGQKQMPLFVDSADMLSQASRSSRPSWNCVRCGASRPIPTSLHPMRSNRLRSFRTGPSSVDRAVVARPPSRDARQGWTANSWGPQPGSRPPR